MFELCSLRGSFSSSSHIARRASLWIRASDSRRRRINPRSLASSSQAIRSALQTSVRGGGRETEAIKSGAKVVHLRDRPAAHNGFVFSLRSLNCAVAGIRLFVCSLARSPLMSQAHTQTRTDKVPKLVSSFGAALQRERESANVGCAGGSVAAGKTNPRDSSIGLPKRKPSRAEPSCALIDARRSQVRVIVARNSPIARLTGRHFSSPICLTLRVVGPRHAHDGRRNDGRANIANRRRPATTIALGWRPDN